MSIGLDTSVTLRLLIGAPRDQADLARDLVASSPTPVVISDLVVGETYFALRHHYGVPHAEAVRAIHALLTDARVRASGNAPAILRELSMLTGRPRPGLIDRLIHADYAQEVLDVATFDQDFAKLPNARLITRS